MEEAALILEYLPNSFKQQAEQDYIAFLWDGFASNYENGQYQFAMLPYHMLYMSFVYCSVWQIKCSRQDHFANSLIFQPQSEKQLLEASSPFTFSEMQERSIFRFLRLIGCEQQNIGKFAKLVDDRNEIAHSNGNIYYKSQREADSKISDIIRQIDAIQDHMTPVLHDCMRSFLLESYDPEQREHIDDQDQIRETLIHANYFSPKDVETCLAFDINTLSGHPDFGAIRGLFDVFAATQKVE